MFLFEDVDAYATANEPQDYTAALFGEVLLKEELVLVQMFNLEDGRNREPVHMIYLDSEGCREAAAMFADLADTLEGISS